MPATDSTWLNDVSMRLVHHFGPDAISLLVLGAFLLTFFIFSWRLND